MKKALYNICVLTIICFCLTCRFGINKVQKTDAKVQSKLVILMYHGFTDGGKESDYVIDVKRLEEDILYLKENGFQFIDTSDLIKFKEKKHNLPAKCVMITFDDGYLNNYTYAFPIIKKHNVKVVISPIAYYVEYYTTHKEPNPDYAQLTENEIKIMHVSGLVDFQNHSYNMHSLKERKGSSRLEYEKTEDYIREFYYDLKAAENVIEDITGKKTNTYVYPFGSISPESESILKCCGYGISLSCAEGFNVIDDFDSNLYRLKRFNRTPERSAEQILRQY